MCQTRATDKLLSHDQTLLSIIEDKRCDWSKLSNKPITTPDLDILIARFHRVQLDIPYLSLPLCDCTVLLHPPNLVGSHLKYSLICRLSLRDNNRVIRLIIQFDALCSIQQFGNTGFPPFRPTLNNRLLSEHLAKNRFLLHRFKGRRTMLTICCIRQWQAKTKYTARCIRLFVHQSCDLCLRVVLVL